MGGVIEAALLIVVTLAVGWMMLCRRAERHRRRGRGRGKREQTANQGRETLKPETMKQVIWVCLLNGIAWVWCSYFLAYLDKPQIAESLSQVAVTEIIGVVLAYAIKSAVENLSKNNRWPDKDDAQEDTPEDRNQAAG